MQLPTPLAFIGCLLSDPIPLPKRRVICRPIFEQINTYYQHLAPVIWIIYIKTKVSYAKPLLLIWPLCNGACVWVDDVDIANKDFPDEIHFIRCATLVLQIWQVIFTSTVISNRVQFNRKRCQTLNLMSDSQLSISTLWQSNWQHSGPEI